MKWRRGTVELVCIFNQRQPVKAWLSGPFAVHRVQARPRCWKVTHVGTGLFIVRKVPTLAASQRFAERLNRLKLDWSFTSPAGPKWIKAKRLAGPTVKWMRRRYKDV